MKLSEYNNIKEENNEQKTDKKEQQKEQIEELFSRYKNFNQSELMAELLKNVNEQKNNGTFDINRLKQTLTSIMPYLSEEQKNNLFTILENIK